MNAALQWFPLLPTPLIAALGIALVALLGLGAWLLRRRRVPRRWVFVLGVLRVGMIATFLLGMLRPVLSFPRRVPLAGDLLVLVDASESMSQKSALGSGTRLDEVRRTLLDSPALQAAARDQTLHWFAFDRQASPLASGAPDGDVLEKLMPQGDATDVAASLTSAVQHVQLLNAGSGAGNGALRVLLVSDGQDQGAADPAAAARELGVAVDVLVPAADSGKAPSAATIADVQAARRVLLSSETAIEATLRAGAATGGLALVLDEDGREIQRRNVGPLQAGQETRVMLTHRPEQPGLKRYVLRIVQGNTQVDKPRAVNVQVTDQRHDVLMLEDSWRWDFKFLRRLLEDDPSFSFTAFLSRGGSAFVQFGEPERRVQLGGFPRSRAELDGFDTLVLGNVDPRGWPRGLARNLHDAVSEGGKSLVVVAGPRLGNWIDVIELTRLLPVELNRESGTPVSGRIDLHVTPEGEASGLFVLPPPKDGEGAAEAAAPAGALPPLEQVYPVVRKRPAAAVLLEAAGQTNAYGPLIVVAEHTVGRGRVLFIATDTLWRWQTLGRRNEAGATLYGSFWQQALRALAPPDPTTLPNELWLRPERTLYRAGERVRLLAEWRSRQSGEIADGASQAGADGAAAPKLSAAVVLPDGSRVPLDLAPEPRDPRRLTAWFDVAASGRYRVEAAARTDAQLLSEMATVIEVTPRRSEQDPAPVDAAFLERLAAATGGRVIDSSKPDGWRAPAAAPAETAVKAHAVDLWRNFSLLLVLCALLAADWTLRLFRGYV